jgi:hypothetical protein
MNRIEGGFVRLILLIWKDEQHEQGETVRYVNFYVNNGQTTRTADPLNDKFGKLHERP